MATTIWKGHLTFGLVSIPVRLYKAARPEKVSFRQLHGSTGKRVRQMLVADVPPEEPEDMNLEEEEPEERAQAPSSRASMTTGRRSSESVPFRAETGPFIVPSAGAAASRTPPVPTPAPPPPPASREISRSEIVRGYEVAKDEYVTLTKEEIAALTPETVREMQVLEFVKLSEVDPIHFETSYYAAPDKGGERPYALLFEALRQSGLVGVAQVTMHGREHVVIVRAGRTGMVLHTMYYQSEIRAEEEYRADPGAVSEKELNLALLLIQNLQTAFEPGKYRDTWKEKVEALIESKRKGEGVVVSAPTKAAPVVNILEALQRSLEASAGNRKPSVREETTAEPVEPAPKPQGRKRRGEGR